MSKKDCGNHGDREGRRLLGLILALLVGFVFVILLIIFIVWLVLRPTKPQFFLQDASVFQFNVSEPNLLTSVIQVTFSSRNPNDRIGIYYDKLDAYADYKSQQITLASAIPPGYQGHGEVDVWSPYLYGQNVPIAPYIADYLSQDESAGLLLFYVKIDGRVRWKVGSWISGHYHIYVQCPALLTFDGSRGLGFSPSMRFQHISTCSVDV